MGHDVYIGPGATFLTTRAKIHIGNYVMSALILQLLLETIVQMFSTDP